MTHFIQTRKQKQLLMKLTLMTYLNQSILQLYHIQKSLGKGSVWIIVSVIEQNINISKYNPLAGSSYINYQKN